jgi:hypothetical protein
VTVLTLSGDVGHAHSSRRNDRGAAELAPVMQRDPLLIC